MMNLWDFENADIHRLVIHLRQTFKPGEVETIPVLLTSADTVLYSGKGLLAAASLVETTGTAQASIDFLDGNDANGTEFVPYNLSAGQSARDQFAPWGLSVERGIFLRVNSGSVRGSIAVVRPR